VKKAVLVLALFIACKERTSPVQTAFETRARDVEIQGAGTVVAILPDDLRGSRHQRFVVRVESGMTLLISHNIDVAPRVMPLRNGDTVEFAGEYIWNAKGGVVHWTHHDPAGRHKAGWVKRDGQTYQ
jgi:hypothetical protein